MNQNIDINNEKEVKKKISFALLYCSENPKCGAPPTPADVCVKCDGHNSHFNECSRNCEAPGGHFKPI